MCLVSDKVQTITVAFKATNRDTLLFTRYINAQRLMMTMMMMMLAMTLWHVDHPGVQTRTIYLSL